MGSINSEDAEVIDEYRTPVTMTLNGRRVECQVPDGELLLETLRERLALKGTKLSCGAEVCGACTVLVDSRPVSSCCTLTVDTDGGEVTTIEGAATIPEFAAVERALLDHAAVQCGFCTPGLVMTLIYLMNRPGPVPDEEELTTFLSGNICRCTGYSSILDAARELLAARA